MSQAPAREVVFCIRVSRKGDEGLAQAEALVGEPPRASAATSE